VTPDIQCSRAGNAILCELYRINRNVSPNGELGFYFNSIESILRTGKPASRLTAATSVVELARIASGDILGKALSLVIYALAVPGQLRAIVAAQLDSVFKTRDVAPYKFFSPYLHQICPIIARNSDTTFALLYTVTDILRTTVAAFLQASDIARIFLSEAIMSQRVEVVQLLAECAQVSPGELLVMNVDICFAPLYFTTITKFEECQKFFMQVLKAQQFKTTFQQLIEGDLPAIILEVLIRADPSQPQQLDNIIHRIFRDLMVMPALSLKQANELLARPGTVLAILGRAGDSLRGLYGKKSSQERMDLLQGMEILVGRVGPQVSGAAPQVMTILQTCFKDREVRCATLRLWKRFLFTLQIQEVKPLIAQTTAVFIQAWPDLLVGEKALVKSILHYFLVDKQVQLEGALAGIADMSNIPGLEEFQKRLCEGRKNKSPEAQMRAYLERLDTVNEATLVQTLKELLRFLKTESAVIHKLAAGTTFSPLLGETVHTLLQTAIRTSEAKSPARPLALQCLGVVGALDPDRMTFPPEETAFVIEYDMRDYDECTRFAIYTIEKVLLRVLRTTNDPQQQSALYLAIQGLASVCGFDNNLRQHGGFKQGIDAAVRQRWNSLPRPVQDVVEPLISASIKVESVAKAEKVEYPLYLNKASYREWLQAWTSDLINTAMLTPAFAGLAPGCHPTKLFGPFRAAVRRGHDLTVPHYVLPFAVFYVLTSANRFAQARISSEIQAVLQDQITSNPSVVMPADSRSLCAQVCLGNYLLPVGRYLIQMLLIRPSSSLWIT
jgi:serine/threonine-protein kinase ATR